MPPSKVTYTLPTDAPPSVLKEDGIESGFIGKLQRIKSGNGFDWHTTGSSKTLTSFKASTLLKENDSIHKCVFVVDRKDLDRQTREEFNRFQEGCVEENTKTAALVRRLLSEDYADKVIVTTIQKLGLALDESSKRNKRLKKNDQPTYKDLVLPLREKENRKRRSLVYNDSLINHCP